MDAVAAEQITTMLLSASQIATLTGQTINQNLAQGLGTIQGAVIQAQASNSDDPAVIAALQTANRSPGGGT